MHIALHVILETISKRFALLIFFCMNLTVIIVLIILIVVVIRFFKNNGAFSTSFEQTPKTEKPKSKPTPRWTVTVKPKLISKYKIESDKKRDAAVEWLAQFLQIDVKELTEMLSDMHRQYQGSFCIRKKSGGFRTIHAPSPKLLKIQQLINQRILKDIKLHPSCVGFREGKSVKDNALPHLSKPYVLKMDLFNFFPLISRIRVRQLFMSFGYPTNIANQLSHLCCYKGKLPQGAATSPMLSNIIAKNLDNVLTEIAKENDLVYTRYADDLTFSGAYIDFETLIPKVYELIRRNDFYPNQSKTRKLKPNRRKIITGISVSNGDKMTIPRAKKREIRQIVYHITTKGLDAHLAKLESKDTHYLNRIIGYLHFWNFVEPDNKFVTSAIGKLTALR